MAKDKYFATLPPKEMARAAQGKIKDFYGYARTTSRVKLFHNVSDAYYGGHRMVGEIGAEGKRGEIKTLKLNLFKSNLMRFDSIIAGAKPVFKARAINSDSSSVEQTRIADDTFEYFQKQCELNAAFSRSRHVAERYGESHLWIDWDASAGSDYGADGTGQVVHEGNPAVRVLTPLDVVRDIHARDAAHTWVAVRHYCNKFDYAAQYEDEAVKDEIMNADPCKWDNEREVTRNVGRANYDTDLICLWTLYHAPTLAVPNGRKTIFTDGGKVIADSEWPRKIPVVSLMPELEDNDIFGYSWAFDMLIALRASNALKTMAFSNCNQYGMPTLYSTGKVRVEEIKDRFVIVHKEPGTELGPLQFPQSPPELFSFADKLDEDSGQMIGLSAVSGGSEDVLKSMPGNAMALLESTTIRYASTFQQNYVRFMEQAATILIETVRDNIVGERMIQISGKDNLPYAKSLTKESLNGFTGFSLDVGNPALQTVQGNEQLAQNLAKAGLVKTAAEYAFVRETGRVDLFTSPESEENILMLEENEMIMRGEVPQVLATDNHELHIRKNRGPLQSQQARKNAQIVQAGLDHLQLHLDMVQTPEGAAFAAALGTAPQGGAPQDPGEQPPPVAEGPEAVEGGGELPSLPTNPVTGQEMDMETGGGMTTPQV